MAFNKFIPAGSTSLPEMQLAFNEGSAQEKTAFQTSVTGGSLLPVPTPWSTVWDTTGNKDLGSYAVSGPLALISSDLGSVVGGRTQAVLVANGANVPTVDGVALSPYSNTNGALNLVTLSRFGNRVFWYCSQPAQSHGITLADYLRMTTLTAATESGDAFSGYTYISTGTGWASSLAVASRSITANVAGEYRAVPGQTPVLVGFAQSATPGYLGIFGVVAGGIGSNYGNWQMSGTIAVAAQQAGDQLKCFIAADGTYTVSVIRVDGSEVALITRVLTGRVWPALSFNGVGTSVGPLIAVTGLA